jgi:predicted nucleotidyltransferase
MAVFVSFARGDETLESDIDILVELKPPGQRPSLGLKWFGLEQELGRILGRDVELVSESAMSPFIRPYVEKDMVQLYEEG